MRAVIGVMAPLISLGGIKIIIDLYPQIRLVLYSQVHLVRLKPNASYVWVSILWYAEQFLSRIVNSNFVAVLRMSTVDLSHEWETRKERQ